MRIVGGLAKGRRLVGPADGTRPTADRAREAMFSSLATTLRLDGARVLDLFAGTGAVGLEALSRGAAEAVLVEKGRAALSVLRRNVELVGLPGATVVARPVSAYLREPPRGAFDLVFADPPYAYPDAKVDDVLSELLANGWLSPDAFVVVERPARTAPSVKGSASLVPTGERRYGDSVLWYGRRR